MVNVFKKFRSLFKKTSKFEVIVDDSLVRQYFEVYCMFNVLYVFPKNDFKYLKNLKEIKVYISPCSVNEEDKFFISRNIKKFDINTKEKIINKFHNYFVFPVKFVFEFENEEEAFYFKMKYC